MSQSNAAQLARAGIAAAKTGDKEQTRRLLREAIDLDPNNEAAWLWLAGVAETPQLALESLQRVLEINPGNDRAREGMKAARLQAGVDGAKAGNKATARRYLLAVIEQDPSNEPAWLWLATLADSPQGMMACLQKVLAINPNNERALLGMKTAKFHTAVADAKAGNSDSARHLLLEITRDEPNNEAAWSWLATLATSPEEERAAWQRVLSINPNSEGARRRIDACWSKLAAPASADAPEPVPPPVPAPMEAAVEAVPIVESQTVAVAPVEEEVSLAEVISVPDEDQLAAAFSSHQLDGPVAETPPVEEDAPVVEPEANGHYEAVALSWECPFCGVAGEEADRCPACGSIVLLTDWDAYQANPELEPSRLKEAIARYEDAAKGQPDFAISFYLGLAYLNLRDLDKALPHLNTASQLRPEDEALRAHVELLTERRNAAATPPPVEKRVRALKSNPMLPSGPRRRLMIVDRSATVRKLVSMTMEKSGFAVTEAADGYQAAEQLLRASPDVILLAGALPGIDGYEVCKLIKGNRETSSIPVILLSGNDGFLDKLRSRMAGFTACLTKPLKPETLVKVVNQHCPAPKSAGVARGA